jgi:hypothetical protein
MNARVSHAGDYWKSTVYLGSKKDVAKMQLATGGSEEIYKVVTLEEI